MLYYNRELSWLSFNDRITNEARNIKHPFLERLNFLTISSSNLDEFMMVRLGFLYNRIAAGYKKNDPAGLDIELQFSKCRYRSFIQRGHQYRLYNRAIRPELNKNNIKLIDSLDALTEDYQRMLLNKVKIDHFIKTKENKILNNKVYVVVKKGNSLTYYKIPEKNRLFYINNHTFILLDGVLDLFFKDYDDIAVIRLLRNTDFMIGREKKPIENLKKKVADRDKGHIITVEIGKEIHQDFMKLLKESLKVGNQEILNVNGPVDLSVLNGIYKHSDLWKLRFDYLSPRIQSGIRKSDNLFNTISKRDVMLFHPYDSFEPVLTILKQASMDENVKQIYMTLYRVASGSKVIDELIKASKNGKKVHVYIEIKARFDEIQNIKLFDQLQAAGIHVLCNYKGLKIHGKLLLIERVEEDQSVYYTHIGSGDYNEETALRYSDIGLFTKDKAITEDVKNFFSMIFNDEACEKWNKCLVSPYWLRPSLLQYINNERENASKGKHAEIILKMNSLTDPVMIQALYEASKAGVKITLIVRDVCSLIAGVEGESENITVLSLVGEYLEHSRIFYFFNDGKEDIYVGSADLTSTDLDKRYEFVFPIEAQDIKKRIMNILDKQIDDKFQLYMMNADHDYFKIRNTKKKNVSSQTYFKREKR